jgi:hypothetical protein
MTMRAVPHLSRTLRTGKPARPDPGPATGAGDP